MLITRFVALAVAAVVGVGTATPALAEDTTTSAVVAGSLLAQQALPAPTWIHLQASQHYLASSWGDGQTIALRDATTGEIVRETPYSVQDEAGQWLETWLVGDSYLVLPKQFPDWVETRAVATGTLVHRLEFGADDKLVAAGAGWALTRRDHDSGPDTVHLLRADGSDVQTTAPDPDPWGYSRAVFQDEQAVLIEHADTTYLVDLSDGSYETVPGGGSLLTPNRIYRRGNTQVSWIGRSDAADTGSFALPAGTYDVRLFRWGADGVAVAYRTGSYEGPVTVATPDSALGSLSTLAENVSAIAAAGDGRLALGLTDTATGRIVLAQPDLPLQEVLDLPTIPAPLGLSGVSGDWVAGGPGEGTAFAPAAGGGQWQSGESTLGIDSGGTETQFAGQTLLSRRLDEGWNLWQVSWPGGHRQFSTPNQVWLGHGGHLVLIRRDGNDVEIQDARTGQVFGTYERNDGGYYGEVAADGTWVWHVENTWNGSNVAVLRGHDTSGASPDRELSGCGGVVDVLGRWVLCTGDTVIDLRGIAPTWTAPRVTGDGELRLGNGFVARPHRDGEEGTPLTLVVTDLSAAHGVQRYGPMRANGYDRDIDASVAVDDAGGPRIVYIDPASQLRTVALEWLVTTPWTRPDKAKPRLATNTGSARIVKSAGTKTSIAAQVTYTDTGTDVEPASGLQNYDARYQTVPRGTAVGTTWTQPSAWKAMPQASVTLNVAAGTDTCFQFRARDNAGNPSTWYTARCVEVDGTGPKITKATAGPRVKVVEAAWDATFEYTATDPAGVAFYEVAYKAATSGKGYGPWTSPTSWKKRTATVVTKQMQRGGDACFRVRATDKVGNLGPWSAEKCTAIAYGQSDFQAIGQTKDDREKLVMDYDTRALDDRVAVMVKAGGELRKSSVTARQIGVWVIQGPGAGKLDVYLGSTKLGRISTAASTRKRVLLMLPAASKSLTGTLRVVSVDGKNAKVDAVVVLRQP